MLMDGQGGYQEFKVNADYKISGLKYSTHRESNAMEGRFFGAKVSLEQRNFFEASGAVSGNDVVPGWEVPFGKFDSTRSPSAEVIARNGLFVAMLSDLVYKDEEIIRKVAQYNGIEVLGVVEVSAKSFAIRIAEKAGELIWNFEPTESLRCVWFRKDDVVYKIFRGSEGWGSNWVDTNFASFPKLLNDGTEVHFGFSEAELLLAEKAKEMGLGTGDDDIIVCGGHSLGGGVATICHLNADGKSKANMRLYTMAAPAVISETISEAKTKDLFVNGTTYHFAASKDPVPQLQALIRNVDVFGITNIIGYTRALCNHSLTYTLCSWIVLIQFLEYPNNTKVYLDTSSDSYKTILRLYESGEGYKGVKRVQHRVNEAYVTSLEQVLRCVDRRLKGCIAQLQQTQQGSASFPSSGFATVDGVIIIGGLGAVVAAAATAVKLYNRCRTDAQAHAHID
jgi:hypothetical protein